MEDARPECCHDEDNLEPAAGQVSADMATVEMVCRVCGRSHYIAAARAKRFGVTGADT